MGSASSTYRKKDDMVPVYSLCISASMSSMGASTSAVVSVIEEGRRTTAEIQWPRRDIFMKETNALEWVYAVLSATLEDFDDHQVQGVRFSPSNIAPKETSDEA